MHARGFVKVRDFVKDGYAVHGERVCGVVRICLLVIRAFAKR